MQRLVRLHELKTGQRIGVSATDARPGVLYGYAFNVSKCRGYMDCVRGCVRENNQDRRSEIKYIRIHEMEKGDQDFGKAQDDFFHEVPAAGHFYIGTQCFHCQNPPCVDVCPVRRRGWSPTGSWWSTTTGASAAGTASPPAPTTRGASTGPIP